MKNNFLKSALEYWDRGISIFPLNPGDKTPLWEELPLYNNGIETKHSWIPFQTERMTRERAIEIWTRHPDANIAGIMGKISGVICVDQDLTKDENRMPILNELGEPKERGDITGFPPTLSATTWSGGNHMIYKYVEGVQTDHSKFRKLIDIQSDGSYIVLAPSIVNGQPYEWNMDWKEMWDTLPAFPVEILPKLQTTFGPKLDIKEFVGVEHGNRNDSMHKLACSLYAKGFSDEEVVFVASAVNKTYKPPLGEHREDKSDEFEKILRSARDFIASEKKKGVANNLVQKKSEAIITCFSDIKSEPINWLWPERIAFGKLTMFSGDPGLGKSLIAIAIAAIVSIKNSLWPVDNIEAPYVDTLILSAEDDSADMIKPRLEAAGADCSHIHILEAIQTEELDSEGNKTLRAFSLKNDIPQLKKAFQSNPNCKVLIIDPISAYLDGTDSHANADVRGLLAPLTDLAAQYKVAVIAVNHLNKSENTKNSLYRSIGSIGFVATARTSFLVTKDKDSREDPPRVLVLPQKSNIAKLRKGFAYSVHTAENKAPFIKWEDKPVDIMADEITLASMNSKEEQAENDWVVDFLEDELRNGPVLVEKIFKEAKKVGIKEKRLRITYAKMGGIKSQKSSYKGGWIWALPNYEGDQDALYKINGNLDILGEVDDKNQQFLTP